MVEYYGIRMNSKREIVNESRILDRKLPPPELPCFTDESDDSEDDTRSTKRSTYQPRVDVSPKNTYKEITTWDYTIRFFRRIIPPEDPSLSAKPPNPQTSTKMTASNSSSTGIAFQASATQNIQTATNNPHRTIRSAESHSNTSSLGSQSHSAQPAIQLASSLTTQATSGWDSSTTVAVVSAGITGALGGAAFVTARQSLDVSKEALETSRGSAAASRSSANTARDTLALNREIFEYNKAKDGLPCEQNRKQPPPDDSNGGDLGQRALSTGVASSETGLAIYDPQVFPSLRGVSVDFSGPSRPRKGGSDDGDDPSLSGAMPSISEPRTRNHEDEEVRTSVGSTRTLSCDQPLTHEVMDAFTGSAEVLASEPRRSSLENGPTNGLGIGDGNWSCWEWDEEKGTYYRLCTNFVDSLAPDLADASIAAECPLLDDATIAALGLNTDVDEVELPDSWWHLLHDREAGRGWAGSREDPPRLPHPAHARLRCGASGNVEVKAT
ncbi:hypothetical protein BDZ45DRAFT_679978 [Acephala macrosclerotiorum]|nr:hypothetical protein BDZ45DRAFT_679978 [Acephala macrosclerotiorum]